MMQIVLNGEKRTIAAGTTLKALVETLVAEETGKDPRGIAIERNLEIVPKSEHGHIVLENGDQLEIVQFVGGG